MKLTVNFDDPGTYHFYFGNDAGAPGSILTFFPWVGIRRGVIGSGQVTATTFAVTTQSAPILGKTIFTDHGVAVTRVGERFGERVIAFSDPDGLPLEVVATPHADPAAGWTNGPVDGEHAICGFHSATLSEEGYEQTARLLQDIMGLRPGLEPRQQVSLQSKWRWRRSNRRCPLHTRWPNGPARVPTRTTSPGARLMTIKQAIWLTDLAALGYNVSPIMDRTVLPFHLLPGAWRRAVRDRQDPPGFTIDEPPEHLDERLMLPPHRATPGVARADAAEARIASRSIEGYAHAIGDCVHDTSDPHASQPMLTRGPAPSGVQGPAASKGEGEGGSLQ